MGVLPQKRILAETTFSVLAEAEKPLKAAIINEMVARLLNIPDEILQIEDANCTGTEYAYQMRWVRTGMKKRGLIINPERGYWALASQKADNIK